MLWPDKMQPSLQHRRPLVWSFLVALIELANGFLIPRQEAASQASSSLVVDLGYATYEGYIDSAFGVNVWKGIRYAEAPVGPLRWQAPREPAKGDKTVIAARDQPPLCPQSGGAGLPDVYGFNSGPGNEDCLFLNVYAPPGAKDLPVFVWIHGGGYGMFGATSDPSPLMQLNGNGFVSVIIQYRLGAFGFLSSEEVRAKGVVNAGLLDQNFALQWVRKNIKRFGGDAERVTVAGESAGAGAAMLQAMAYGGKQKDKLFDNVIAASPYLPPQFNYNDPVPTHNYQAFANAAGCGNTASNVFDCLVNADTATLQTASGVVSTSGQYGTWAFQPVTDGDFVQGLPSQQLQSGQVNGRRILSGNNANEGVPLSPPTAQTAEDFLNYVRTTYPGLTEADLARLQEVYPSDGSPVDPSAPLFDTLGDAGPTAVNQSGFGTGQRQRLFNLYAEATYVCPSYWLAEAYTGDKQSWKYQFSVTPAYHGFDLTAYFSRDAGTPTQGIIAAFLKVWGSFIINNSPIISVADAKAGTPNAIVPEAPDGNIDWPTYSNERPVQMDFNSTGGTETTITVTEQLAFKLRLDPGVSNVFRLVDARAWEGGRGARCDFWRSVGPRVPQ